MQLLLDLIHPISGRHVKVTPENVDMILALLVEYQVERLKDECE